MNTVQHPTEPLTLEMMRTFVVLANTLNVSETERLLNKTRQTIRRHISSLEKHRGGPLFDIVDQSYQLSRMGKESLPAARKLISDAQNWSIGRNPKSIALEYYSNYQNATNYTYLEQKGLDDVFGSESPFLKECLLLWMRADGKLDRLDPIREYGMVFRKYGEGWVTVEVGTKSSSATWFGETWLKSCIGSRVPNLPSSDMNAIISKDAFEGMGNPHSARLDHISTCFPREGYSNPQPHNYRRLMMLCTFDDGSPALINIVERTNDLKIANLPENLRTGMAEDQVMSVTLGEKML